MKPWGKWQVKMQGRRPQCGLTRARIDFGTGTRALKMWTALDVLMPAVVQTLKNVGHPSQARLLVDWQRSFNYRVPELIGSWVMELDGEQWAALSRGLRHLGPKGRARLDWIYQHVEYTYPEGGVVYSPTYRRPKL